MKRLLALLCLIFFAFPLHAEVVRIPVTLHGQDGDHVFQLEYVTTREELEKGLMFRDTLPADGGMLFSYHPAQSVYMWMRNTRIPLDMLFINDKNMIVHTVHEAEPFDETPLGTPLLITAVLELPGGTLDKLKISEGDRVEFALPKAKP